MTSPPPHVESIDETRIILRNLSPSLSKEIYKAAAVEHDGSLQISISSEEEQIEIMKICQKLDIAFSIGRSWSPSEVFEYLREQHKLQGTFLEIAWRGPGQWVTRENAG
jgi:hypothetical protein